MFSMLSLLLSQFLLLASSTTGEYAEICDSLQHQVPSKCGWNLNVKQYSGVRNGESLVDGAAGESIIKSKQENAK